MNTALEKDWSEVRQIDKDEEEFCLAAARLGLDPYSEAVELESEILRAAEQLSGNMFGDFLDAVSPRRIGAALNWISSAGRLIRGSARQADRSISGLRSRTLRRGEARGARPWELGWRQAARVRRSLGISPEDLLEIDELVDSKIQGTDDRGLQAVGGMPSKATPVVVPGRRERAFAAELLAPARAVAELLGGAPDVVVSEDLEQVARHFHVSPMVVRHQVENQLSASVVG